ncbi:STAS domain-containing protein [Asanoa sp. NPDC049518]|uniref:STAS domain-containing protein n=1 Tax=unclassified Asanoa TaxID=2685164 RepID=UPI003425D379
MTAVPSPTGQTIDVICDSCGVVVTATNTCVHDEELVRTVLIEIGWAGSPFAAGRHTCVPCATRASSRRPAEGKTVGESPSRASYSLREEAGIVVVAARGDIELGSAEELRMLLTMAIGAGQPVVLDLDGVNLVDAAALGVMVRARQTAKQLEVPLCLAAPSRFLLTVLHTMRLRRAFPIFASRAAAVGALARTAPPEATGSAGLVAGELVMRPS